MLLGANDIEREISDGHLCISPFSTDRLKPASYVLSLDRRFRRWRRLNEVIRPWTSGAGSEHLEDAFEASTLVVVPGEFTLGCTIERVSLPMELFGTLSPLSHIARFGLSIHCGADYINPGFGASEPTAITLEIANFNSSPIELRAGMPIAHLRIGHVGGLSSIAGRSRSIYDGVDPLVAPLLFEEWSGLIAFGDDTPPELTS